uniref:Uncharacterized protein n=1 Tax=Zonotrichia albicollis TaxID=44394 RepID=A0A8D2MKL5_ZONAL
MQLAPCSTADFSGLYKSEQKIRILDWVNSFMSSGIQHFVQEVFLLLSQWNPGTAVHEGKVVTEQELTSLLQPLLTQNSRNLVLFLQDRVCPPRLRGISNLEIRPETDGFRNQVVCKEIGT